MNLLTVSEKYTNGGLETHIKTLYNEIKDDNNIVFALGKYNTDDDLKDAKIYKDFNFSYTSTIKDFINDTNRLIDIIKKEKISVIHVHPFYSLFPVIFASNETNTPLIYTYHGVSSFNFYIANNTAFLYLYSIEKCIDKVLCVRDMASNPFEQISNNLSVYFPNVINENKYFKHNIVNNKKWAFITRLDDDKVKEIKKVIDYFPNIDMSGIDIYGLGIVEKEIKDYIKQKNLEDKIVLKGHSNNIVADLNNNYNGVIGLGRVAIEALSMNYPVILSGYGKISGIVTDEMYEKIKRNNLINEPIDCVTCETLNEQLKLVYSKNNYNYREKVISDFSVHKWASNYLDILNKRNHKFLNNLKTLYEDIKKIEDKNQSMYDSSEIFFLLKKYIEPFTMNIELKNLFVSFSRSHNVSRELYDSLYHENVEIKKNIKKLVSEIENLNKKIHALEMEK